MVIQTNLTIEEKLAILTDAAKYDVACTSSGVDRRGKTGSMGNSASCGICHCFSADGRCISLLKILMTNICIYDCRYCINRASNDQVRTAFTPEEICQLTMEFYKRNYIEGLFLSSGVVRSPDDTMSMIYETLWTLRNRFHFRGYIHVKAIPGADPELIRLTGLLADRMSVNLELPTGDALRELAPAKSREKILTPMRQIQQGIAVSRLQSEDVKRSRGTRRISGAYPGREQLPAADVVRAAGGGGALFDSGTAGEGSALFDSGTAGGEVVLCDSGTAGGEAVLCVSGTAGGEAVLCDSGTAGGAGALFDSGIPGGEADLCDSGTAQAGSERINLLTQAGVGARAGRNHHTSLNTNGAGSDRGPFLSQEGVRTSSGRGIPSSVDTDGAESETIYLSSQNNIGSASGWDAHFSQGHSKGLEEGNSFSCQAESGSSSRIYIPQGQRFVPAGQSTQMIIGASGETDYQVLAVTSALYNRFDLKRVFYSAYTALNDDSHLPAIDTPPPLGREHRLYQADWLLRYYNFRADELLTEDKPWFNLFMDPKCDWAIRHLDRFPVEVTTADYNTLLRVPGIGVKSAKRILAARRYGRMDFDALRRMGVVIRRAGYFITCHGLPLLPLKLEEDYLAAQLITPEQRLQAEIDGSAGSYRQLSLFDDFHMDGVG